MSSLHLTTVALLFTSAIALAQQFDRHDRGFDRRDLCAGHIEGGYSIPGAPQTLNIDLLSRGGNNVLIVFSAPGSSAATIDGTCVQTSASQALLQATGPTLVMNLNIYSSGQVNG